jgi:hypothetical protein
MSNIETNLRSAAREAFRLYPEVYRVDQPTDKAQIEELADEYGRYDGFYDAGLTPEQSFALVLKEWEDWKNSCNSQDEN